MSDAQKNPVNPGTALVVQAGVLCTSRKILAAVIPVPQVGGILAQGTAGGRNREMSLRHTNKIICLSRVLDSGLTSAKLTPVNLGSVEVGGQMAEWLKALVC